MKVTIIAGGVPTEKYPIQGIFEYTQATALAATGVDVSYLALDFRPISVHRHLGLMRYDKDGISIYHFSLPTGIYRRGLWFIQKIALQLFKKIEKEKGHQDIIHTHFYSIGAICSQIPHYCGVKMVATEHSSKLNKPSSRISALDKKIARKAYSNASVVIAVSECLASRVRDNFSVEPIVVGNVVGGAFSRVSRAEHNGFNILSVGRLIDSKRFEDLIRAFHKVSNSCCAEATLTIVGEGPLKSVLQKLIDTLGLSSKVTLYGGASSEDIVKLMSSADLFALMSESETFGVVYTEALTAGVPVLATRCGGPEGFVTNENGILVDVGDIDGAANAINSIANGSLKFSEETIRCSAAQFEPSEVANKLIEIYKSVLG